MVVSISLGGLVFHPVEATTTTIGTTKGGWVYAGHRPCYEAKTPAFYAMVAPLTNREVLEVMGGPDGNTDEGAMETLTSLDLTELAQTLMETEAFSTAVEALPGAWEVRALTHAEW